MPTTAAATAPVPLKPALATAVRALGASAGGASASRLLALLYDPDVDVDRILQCLHGEPVLAARVLKVANAPYYGRSGQVGSVERAVQLLGLVAIRGIAAAGALDRLTPARAGQVFDPVRFRRHSAAVACAAQGLSRLARCGIDGEAFMAGLLHDIGVLLLVKSDPAAMAAFQPPQTLDPEEARAVETRHFGLDHESAGTLIIEAWALPAWMKTAVQHHHAGVAPDAPSGEGLEQLPRLLLLADRLAAAAGFGLWPRCAGPWQDVDLGGLALRAESLQALLDGLPASVDALSSGS